MPAMTPEEKLKIYQDVKARSEEAQAKQDEFENNIVEREIKINEKTSDDFLKVMVAIVIFIFVMWYFFGGGLDKQAAIQIKLKHLLLRMQ